MKDLVDVIDELDEVVDLLWSAFMAANSMKSRDGAALSRLLNNIRGSAEQAREELSALIAPEERDAA